MSGKADRFPTTHHSAVCAAGSEDQDVRRKSHEHIVEAYWKPLYKYARIKFRLAPAETEDKIQAFFLIALEKNYFADFDPEKSRFRTFMRLCLDRYIASATRNERAQKRGGGHSIVPLDFGEAERELEYIKPDITSPEDTYHREFIRHLFDRALDALRIEFNTDGKDTHILLFERYDLADYENRPTYRSLAEEFELSETQVTNHLAATRRTFKKIVRNLLWQSCGSEEEFEREVRAIMGMFR